MREQDKMQENLQVGRWVRHSEKMKPFQLNEGHFSGVSAKNAEWFSKIRLWRPHNGEPVVEVYEDYVIVTSYHHTKGLPNVIPYVGQTLKSML